MNIGIDIDGVLTDLERMAIDCGTKMCVDEKLPINIDVSEYYEITKFNWTDEQEERFWNKYLVPYVVESEPRAFAREIIDKLQVEGNKIFFITARNESGMPPEYYGQMQQLTKQWLDAKNIRYEKLIFAKNEDKLQQCLENKIDVMIEDCPDNIKNISSKIKVIKFDCQYNKNTSGENIINAYSWYHIYQIINEIK